MKSRDLLMFIYLVSIWSNLKFTALCCSLNRIHRSSFLRKIFKTLPLIRLRDIVISLVYRISHLRHTFGHDWRSVLRLLIVIVDLVHFLIPITMLLFFLLLVWRQEAFFKEIKIISIYKTRLVPQRLYGWSDLLFKWFLVIIFWNWF